MIDHAMIERTERDIWFLDSAEAHRPLSKEDLEQRKALYRQLKKLRGEPPEEITIEAARAPIGPGGIDAVASLEATA